MIEFPMHLKAGLTHRVERGVHTTLNHMMTEMERLHIPDEISAAVVVAAITKIAVDIERTRPDMRGVVVNGISLFHEELDKRDKARAENPKGENEELLAMLRKVLGI